MDEISKQTVLTEWHKLNDRQMDRQLDGRTVTLRTLLPIA